MTIYIVSVFYAHSTVDLGMKLELGVVVKDLKDGSLPYLHGVRIGDEICQVCVCVGQLLRGCVWWCF